MLSPLCDIAVQFDNEHADQCRHLAATLSLPIAESIVAADAFSYVLRYTAQGLALQQTGAGAPGPVQVDFVSGAASYRRNKGGGELIVKAVAGDRSRRPSVVDATAGLGRDGFVLASWGYSVTLCERSAVVALLLEDGMRRAEACGDPELAAVMAQMRLHKGDAVSYLRCFGGGEPPDVVVIDPMFPVSGKSALVKKEMRAFHHLVGADCDSEALLAAALAVARHRVVVKRPKKAEALAGKKPNFSVAGKAIRFDIYTIRAFAKRSATD